MKRLFIAAAAAILLVANPIGTCMTAEAATPGASVSDFWEQQADGSWKIKEKDGTYAIGWNVDFVDDYWYFMDAAGVMQTGLCKIDGKYYLLSQNHDGHFGHSLKNGENYNGIIIVSEDGSLSETTVNQLRSCGFNVDGAPTFDSNKILLDSMPATDSNSALNSTTNQDSGKEYEVGGHIVSESTLSHLNNFAKMISDLGLKVDGPIKIGGF